MARRREATTTRATGEVSRGVARGASLALRLTLGLSVDAASAADWQLALSVATRERLVPLSWHRSAAGIRRRAPAPVTDAWRARALGGIAEAARAVGLLGEVVERLRGAGVEPVVLKGLPLAQRLHGDVALRPSGDLDLFIPAEERARADAALAASGWRRSYGTPPREAAYRRLEGGREQVVEVHSSLSDDNLLEHLRFPAPGWRETVVGTTAVRAHDDDLLAAYLATHLAKRAAPPLLWVVDVAVLWAELDPEERARARAAARRQRAERYLERALALAAALPAAAGGAPRALALLGFGEDGRHDGHNAIRVARLAANPVDAARVALAWAWPHPLRYRPAAYARAAADRIVRPRRPLATAVTRYATDRVEPPPAEALPVSAPLHEAVRTLVEAGAPVWIRATGESMRPAIVPGTRVRLVPLPARTLLRGEVVLAALPSGATVLHRVRRERHGVVHLRGDNTAAPDVPVSRERVVALADALENGGRVRPVDHAAHLTLHALAGDVRRLARAVLAPAIARRA